MESIRGELLSIWRSINAIDGISNDVHYCILYTRRINAVFPKDTYKLQPVTQDGYITEYYSTVNTLRIKYGYMEHNLNGTQDFNLPE